LYDDREPIGASAGERWVDPFLNDRKFELCETISRSQENPRLRIPRFIRQYRPNCDVELIFNFNEVGILASDDRVPRKAIPAVSMSHQTTSHGVSDNLKTRLVVCCGEVSGESATLFGVSSQANELAIEKQKFEQCGIGIRFILAQKQKPYVSAALF
jgi:hypothetical protein